MLRKVSLVVLLIMAALFSGCFGGRSSRVYHTLTIEVHGEGQTVPDSGDHRYAEGMTIDITAHPEDNYQFSHMLGDVVELGKDVDLPRYQTPMDKHKTIVAVFTQIHDVEPVIQAVAPVMDFSVPFGTPRSEVMDYLRSRRDRIWIVDSNGERTPVRVVWDDIIGYRGDQPGSYPVEATFSLPAGVAQSVPPRSLEFTTWVEVQRNWPKITNIAGVGDATVLWGTTASEARAALARETTITDTDGRTHPVSLLWEIVDYDHERAGTYQAIGRFELPEQVSQTMPPTDLEVRAELHVEHREPAAIRNVRSVGDLSVSWGTTEASLLDILPDTAVIVDERYEFWNVPVQWSLDEYDPTVQGIYPIVGRFELPPQVRQSEPPKDLRVRLNVSVSDRELPYLQRVIVPTTSREFPHGTTRDQVLDRLPATTEIRDSDNAAHIVGLDWLLQYYDGNTAGAYVATAAFELPSGVMQSYPPKPLNFDIEVKVSDRPAPRLTEVRWSEPDLVEVPWGSSWNHVRDVLNWNLPNRVTIVDDWGDRHTVDLNWIEPVNYHPEQPKVYETRGVFQLPPGVADADPHIPLSVVARFELSDSTRLIIRRVEGFGDLTVTVPWNSTVESVTTRLPTQILAIDHHGDEHRIEMSWQVPAGNLLTPGTYMVGGRLRLDETIFVPYELADADRPRIRVDSTDESGAAVYRINMANTSGGIVNWTSNDPTDGQYLAAGSTVSFAAQPDTGYEFVGWTHDLQGTNNPTSKNVTSNLTVGAEFSRLEHTVTFRWDDPDDGVQVETRQVLHGETVGNPPVPRTISGYQFDWQNSNQMTNVTSNREISGAYGSITHGLTVRVEGQGSVTVTISGQVSTVSGIDSFTAQDGQRVDFGNPLPASGYNFLGWEGVVNTHSSEGSFYLRNDSVLTARFGEGYSVIFVAPDPQNPSNTKVVDNGRFDNVQIGDLIPVPPAPLIAGYEFSHWNRSFVEVSDRDYLRVEGNATVTAVYDALEFYLAISFPGDSGFLNWLQINGARVPTTANRNYKVGSELRFSVQPPDGYEFVRWGGDLDHDTESPEVTYVMPAHDALVEAYFRRVD